MRKRYYVEVTDLDNENGRKQLEQAGISRDHILVVESDEEYLVSAIREVTGVGSEGIFGHGSERNMVAARTMYVHYALVRGDSVGMLCERMGRPRCRIRYYAKDYEPKTFGDREFRVATERVQQILDADPRWRPARTERPLSSKRRKGRKRKRHAPQAKAKLQTKAANSLEQEIPFTWD